MRVTERDERRFWSKVALPNEQGCMLWMDVPNANGYAHFWVDGRNFRAHRVAYQLAYGPVPTGAVVDHVRARGCTNRHCVAPGHLEAVTQQENVLRGELRRGTHCPHGHAYKGDNLYVRPGTDRWECRACNRDRKARRRAA